MKRKYKIIMFDLDGTLIDSGEGIRYTVASVLAKFGITGKSDEELNKYIGPPLLESFTKLDHLTESEARQGIEYYHEFYEEKGMYACSIYPGIDKLLLDLKSAGYILAVATGKPEYFALKILEHIGLLKYFDCIGGCTMDETRIAKNELIEYNLEKLNFSNRESVIIIGDHRGDIDGAKQTNIDSIGVLYGFGSYEEITRSQPTFIASTPEDLRHIFL